MAARTVLFVGLALFGISIAQLLLPNPQDLPATLRTITLIGPSWLLASAILAIVTVVEGRGLNSIGIERPTLRDSGWALVAFVVGVLTFLVTEPLVESLGLTATTSTLDELGALPVWVPIAMALTAGVTEEILFRGYPIERVTDLTGDLRVAAALTVVVFTLAHVPLWGVGGALQVGAWTVVVTVLYVRLRNLPACMLMHVCNDLFAFVLVPIFIG